MFGSDFFAQFGIPAFPLQGMDPQGGALGTNVPPQIDPSGNHTSSPPAGQPPASPPASGAYNPLALGPLSPGGGAAGVSQPTPPEQAPAPAAGIGSQFGKPGL